LVFLNIAPVLIYIRKIYDASFTPVNFVFAFYIDKRSMDFFVFIGGKRSIENKLNKIKTGS